MPESSCLREERKIVVHRAMGKLKPEYGQVLQLSCFEGFGAREIGGAAQEQFGAVLAACQQEVRSGHAPAQTGKRRGGDPFRAPAAP